METYFPLLGRLRHAEVWSPTPHRRQDGDSDSGFAPERRITGEGPVLRQSLQRFLETHRAGLEPECRYPRLRTQNRNTEEIWNRTMGHLSPLHSSGQHGQGHHRFRTQRLRHLENNLPTTRVGLFQRPEGWRISGDSARPRVSDAHPAVVKRSESKGSSGEIGLLERNSRTSYATTALLSSLIPTPSVEP